MAMQSAGVGKKFTTQGVKRKELIALVESQEYRCALSGMELEPSIASLDHIVAVSNGGTHEIENLQVLHREINHMKGSMSNEKFIEMCKRVAAWNS